MPLQDVTIDFGYLVLTAMGDVFLAALAGVVLLAVIDGLISGLQMLRQGE